MNLQIEDLNFDYISLANYYGPYLPYSQSLIEAAFPGTVVKQEQVIIYQSERTLFCVYVDGLDKPAFCVHGSGDTWFNDDTGEWAGTSASIVIKESPALIFGAFQVGKTTLKEFRDAHLNTFDDGFKGCTWSKKDQLLSEDKESIILRGGRETKLYNSRFEFFSPNEFEGQLHLAPQEILEESVLTEVHFFFSDHEALPDNIMGLGLPKDDVNGAALEEKKKVLKKAVKTSKTPLELVLENQKLLIAAERFKHFTKKSALEGYLTLSELLIHDIDPLILKDNIKDAFKSTRKRKPLDLFFAILNMENIGGKQFFLNFDWKESAFEFDQRVRQNLANIDMENIPVIDSKSVMINDVIDEYEKILNKIGVELQYIDTGNDQHVLCLYKSEDKISIVEQLAKTQIHFPGE